MLYALQAHELIALKLAEGTTDRQFIGVSPRRRLNIKLERSFIQDGAVQAVGKDLQTRSGLPKSETETQKWSCRRFWLKYVCYPGR